MSDTTEAPRPPEMGKGSPEGAEWLRQALDELGETQSSLARLMQRNGDDRQPGTILRNIQRMANGEARVSGEMRVILTMLRDAKLKRDAQDVPDTQRELMKKLVRSLGKDKTLVCAAYAEAEQLGKIVRASNAYATTAERYAAALWSDGVRKGWLFAD